ncbi:MAG TPA: DUF2142 domain-containing protein [Actinocrinis sp.]|nr:DUF2142 domain-containing protein [Actinocrinis sp.]
MSATSALRRGWWLALAGFFALSAAFALGTPKQYGPDEPAHLMRAASAVRFEVSNYRDSRAMLGPAYLTPIWLPENWALWGDQTQVFTGHAGHPRCTGPHAAQLERNDAVSAREYAHSSSPCEVLASTYEGSYSPVYYLLVGAPSLFMGYNKGIYAMRLISGLLSALLLASAVRTAAESRARRAAVLGVIAAATPSALFISGVVNPSGAEIPAAVLTWTVLLSLALDPDPALLRRRLIRLAAGCSLLMTARTLGPVWVCVAFAVAALTAVLVRPELLRRLKRRPRLLPLNRTLAGHRVEVLGAGAVILVAAAVAIGWDLYAGGTSVTVKGHRAPLHVAALKILGTTWFYIRQEIGQFGWGYQVSPVPIMLAGAALVAGLVLAAWAVAPRRMVGLLALVVAAALFIGVPLNAPDYNTLDWIGRYQLPMFVAAPVLAGLLLGKYAPQALRGPRAQTRPVRLLRGAVRFAPWSFALLMVVSLAGFYISLAMQYSGGYQNPMPVPVGWRPPTGWIPVSALCAAGVALLTWLVLRASLPARSAATQDAAPLLTEKRPEERRPARRG